MMADVKIYTTPTCPWCKKTKEYLRDKGVEFDEIDVSSDQEAARDMIEKSGQMGVPQTMIGDEVIVGFDTDSIDKALQENA